MILFPAIDLRQGRCVRLRQGDPNSETVYGDDPAAMARHWLELGAQWLHVVNLDGAFGEAVGGSRTLGSGSSPEQGALLPTNLQRLAQIRQAVSIPIQFGGGLRTLDDAALALSLGATRVVLGTVAVQQPELVREAIARFGAERIVVGIDARDGNVATHGWQETSTIEAVTLAMAMKDAGVQRLVYTDISRDGMLQGVNVAATAELARQSNMYVIASGGVHTVADIRALRAVADDGVEGVIIGQALYQGTLDLPQALQAAKR